MEEKVERFAAVKIADNIVSPLGLSSMENYIAVKQGRTALLQYSKWGLPEPFTASLIEREVICKEFERIKGAGGRTLFENLAILSVLRAVESRESFGFGVGVGDFGSKDSFGVGFGVSDFKSRESRESKEGKEGLDLSSDRVLFVLSTTKGNVFLMDDKCVAGGEFGDNLAALPKERILLGEAAKVITDYFGHKDNAVVVSNACISGLCAQIEAVRALKSGNYDYAVVIGCDVQSPFIVSGFQSFKALSNEPCKPFDINRKGLNLGEAAATVIYKRVVEEDIKPTDWVACRGAIRNDANHISGPSRTGEGSYRALMAVLDGVDRDKLAFVNLHGTATLYNDEMESIALNRAGLSDLPANGLKGYYGHTMGAAGVLESILSICSADDNTILATKGFEEQGTTYRVNVCCENRVTDKNAFVKLLSGFGGCNAALLFNRGGILW